MKKKILMLTAAAVLPFAAANANACEDDKRLYDLRPFVADIEAGKDVEDLMLTGHTYLSLNPDLRETIGDNIKVYDSDCQAHAVVNGVPVTKVQAPFPEIMNAYKNAVYSGDGATTKLIAEGFKAAPLPDDILFSLAHPMTESRETIAKLGQPIGVYLHADSQKTKDGGKKTKATLLDFFVRFDGVSSDPETYIYDTRGYSAGLPTEIRIYQPGTEKSFAYAETFSEDADVVLNNAQLLHLFAQTGMKFIEVDTVGRKAEEKYKKAVRGR
ncbi:hypothetical protein [Marinobacter flavimaris]|uniref:hypothetical protein n=1 Tax=Marinobacter flavimaris TaxID=262076 RepID=UPI0038683F58